MEFISSIFLFIQNEILGMQWLNRLVAELLQVMEVDLATRIGASLHFFIYDVIKILLLLSFLIFIISYIQSYFPPERTKRILGKFKGFSANIIGALLGTITPFCSCSSIPLFIGFTNAGLPIGVTFSFLISSPLVDLGAFILLVSIFGFKIAIVYVLVGLLLAVLGGTIIDNLKLEKYVEEYIHQVNSIDIEVPNLTKSDRVQFAKEQTLQTVKKVIAYVFIGVGVGALIHNWIPTEFILNILGKDNPFSVLLATLFGLPMYADIFGTIPIAEALFAKGVGIGTVLSFMMAVTALSLPSIILLRKAVKPKLLIIFIAIVTVGILSIGYIFNVVQFILI